MSDEQQVEVEQPFITHLLELRDRLLRMVLAVLILFVALFPFANDIYQFIADPLQQRLHEMNSTMIATQVISPFLAPFKTTLILCVFIAMPYILYQLWAFVAPGLYKHEQQRVVPLLTSSILLFYLGMVFAYFVVFPLIFDFMVNTTPDGVEMQTDINSYLDFVLTLFFAFGFAFEVPIATIILVMMGMTTPESLRQKRPYIIVAAFIIGMFLTPPDVISQTLLALPMWVLFEFGVFFSTAFVKKDEDEEDEPEPTPPSVPPQDKKLSKSDDGSEPAATDRSDDEPKPSSGGGTAAAAATASTAATEAAESSDWATAVKAATADGDEAVEGANKPLRYPEDFVPLTDEEMEAELDRMDEEEDDQDDDDEDDIYSDYDDHSGDGGDQASGENLVDVKLAQVMEYREANDMRTARALLYEVLEEGDETQIRVARNILNELDTDD